MCLFGFLEIRVAVSRPSFTDSDKEASAFVILLFFSLLVRNN